MGTFFSKQKKLIILRGLPGSGKTTLAKQIANNYGLIFSTNDYFYQKDGSYKFNAKKLKDAHFWNQDRATHAMSKNKPLIIINNNHIRKWEARPYIEVALKYNYDIEIIETDTPWRNNINELATRNNFNVPIKVIENMLNDWESDFTITNILNSRAPWE